MNPGSLTKVNFPRSLNTNKVTNSLIFLEEFTETFTDPVLIGILSKVAKSNFISEHQIKTINKRKSVISKKEIQHPKVYLIKYWRGLVPLFIAVHCNATNISISNRNFELMDSLIAYFHQYGYLTKKDISALKKLMFNHKITVLKTSKDFIKKDNWNILYQQDRLKPLEEFLESILKKLQPDIIDNLDFFKTDEISDNIFYQLLVELLKKRTARLIYGEEKTKHHPIPQTFLTLNEMRKALTYNH